MTGKCLKKHYGACRFRDQNDDCLWTFGGCHFHSAESPQAASEADVTLNDLLCGKKLVDAHERVWGLLNKARKGGKCEKWENGYLAGIQEAAKIFKVRLD